MPVKDAGSVSQIVGRVMAVPEITDVRIISANWTADGAVESVLNRDAGQLEIYGFPTVLGDLQIADPSLPTRVNVIVSFPENEPPPDRATIPNDLTSALAYWNELNARELAADADEATRQKRVVSYGKLLLAVSLPGKPGLALATYDDAVVSGTASPLPDETDVAPYELQIVFTMESGVSRLLTRAADDPYPLTPFERLSLSGLELQTKPSND